VVVPGQSAADTHTDPLDELADATLLDDDADVATVLDATDGGAPPKPPPLDAADVDEATFVAPPFAGPEVLDAPLGAPPAPPSAPIPALDACDPSLEEPRAPPLATRSGP
jgi:hypothetical protein